MGGALHQVPLIRIKLWRMHDICWDIWWLEAPRTARHSAAQRSRLPGRGGTEVEPPYWMSSWLAWAVPGRWGLCFWRPSSPSPHGWLSGRRSPCLTAESPLTPLQSQSARPVPSPPRPPPPAPRPPPPTARTRCTLPGARRWRRLATTACWLSASLGGRGTWRCRCAGIGGILKSVDVGVNVEECRRRRINE